MRFTAVRGEFRRFKTVVVILIVAMFIRECKRENCNKYAQGRSGLCVNHGGGRKCIFPDCEKVWFITAILVERTINIICLQRSQVARGTTSFCVAHGGGTRCQQHGCSREALVGQTTCRKHALGGRAVKGANLGTQEFCGVCSKKKRKLISNRLGADEQVNSDSRPFKRPKRWVTNIVDIDDAIPTDIGAINQLLISDEILLANDALLALEYWGQQENVEAVDDKDVVEYAHCYPEIPNSGASLTRNRGCVVALSLNEDDVVADLNEIMQSNTAGLT